MTSTFKWLGGGLAAVMLLGLAGLFGGGDAAAQEPAGPPHQFDGSVSVDGAPAAAGTSVRAMVDGRECGAATVTTGASGSTYVLHVPTDCAAADATVNFSVGGHPAAETGTYAAGTRTALNLTASSDMAVDPGMDGDDMGGDEPTEPGDDMGGDEPAEPGDDMGGDEPAEPGGDMDNGDMPGDDMDDPMAGHTGSGLAPVASASLAAIMGAIALAVVFGGTVYARRR